MNKSIAAVPGRKVTYKFQRPDFFVVTGETASGEFYIRYALGTEGLRGFTYAYDKSVKAEATRLMIAIANSFVPFPEAAPTANAASPTPLAQTAPTAMPVRSTVDAAKVTTGIRVGGRQVVTIGLTCNAPIAGGVPARIVKQSGDLTLLELAAEKPVTPLPLRSGPLIAGTALVTVGWDASAKTIGVASGSGQEGDVFSAALQPGGRGGLVFDRNGAVVGMVGGAKTPLRIMSGVAMTSSYALVSVKDIQSFIGGTGGFSGEVAAEAALTAGSIANAAAPRIVDVACP